jgi:hypothetical protein
MRRRHQAAQPAIPIASRRAPGSGTVCEGGPPVVCASIVGVVIVGVVVEGVVTTWAPVVGMVVVVVVEVVGVLNLASSGASLG